MKRYLNTFLLVVVLLNLMFLTTCADAQSENLTAEQPAVIENDNLTIAEESTESSKTIKVTVSSEGYQPESIQVKKGQPVKLAFYRADADNCGGEVVFPKLNIKKKLPVGKTVPIEFTPQESGELAFTCGMDMMRGKVIVQ